MMNDKELLELAAKACGYEFNYGWINCDGHTLYEDSIYINGRAWNPLTDDGDALRLAVKLQLEIDSSEHVVRVGYYTGEWRTDYIHENFDSDSYAATRRAIVRAAAEIGNTK